jgi:hypothetical protein
MSQKEVLQVPSKEHAGARETLLGISDILRTSFGLDTVIRIHQDAKKIDDPRIDKDDKYDFARECRYVFGIDPVKTYSEFVQEYDGKKPLVVYFLERLKTEKVSLKHQIFTPMTEAENIEEEYYKHKGYRHKVPRRE